MGGKIRGNKTLSGTHLEVWINGERVWETSAITAKITANRETIQIGMDEDSKITGLKGEGSLKIHKVYTRYNDVLKDWKNGKDVRCQIVGNLKDPDAVGEQMERYSIGNVWFNELPLVNWETGGKIEEEIPFGFTPSDLEPLDEIKTID